MSRGIALPFHDLGAEMSVDGHDHAPAALPPGKNWCPLYTRLSGPQGLSGRVLKISPPTGIQSPDSPARSESLYRLSYSGPMTYFDKKICHIHFRPHHLKVQAVSIVIFFPVMFVFIAVLTVEVVFLLGYDAV